MPQVVVADAVQNLPESPRVPIKNAGVAPMPGPIALAGHFLSPSERLLDGPVEHDDAMCDAPTMIPTDRAAWSQLPELPIRTIGSNTEKGDFYTVEKIGFVLVPREKPDDVAGPAGKTPLPTVVTKEGASSVLRRLPVGLTTWALMVVDEVHRTGDNPFPCLVEFCLLNGRPTADFVVD